MSTSESAMERRSKSEGPSPTLNFRLSPIPAYTRACGCAHRFMPGENSPGTQRAMVSAREAMLRTDSVRDFWERRVKQEDNHDNHNHVWNNIYCTIRDRQRSRSRTSTRSVPRSLTPSSVSSGRTTPSPGLQYQPMSRAMSEEALSLSWNRRACTSPRSKSKYQTTCWLVPRSVPVLYSSTIFIQLGSTKRRYLEQIVFQKRLLPRKFSESMEMATEPLCRCYTSEITIPCQASPNVINLEQQQKSDAHQLTTVI